MLKMKNFVQFLCCSFMVLAQSLHADCAVFTSVKSAYLHSLGLRNDGSVWAWGHNNYGQVGNGTTDDVLIPTEVSGMPSATTCEAGFYHSLAVAANGTVWAWGKNNYGQLGNGSTDDSLTAVQVSNLTGITAVAGGGFHSLALASDGTVWAWGYNYYGQLGNGARGQSKVPVQVSGLTDVIAIDCGGYFSLALKSDGTVWAWGNNLYGQLGDGTTTDSYIPIQVPGILGVTSIAAGSLHALALQSDDTLWAWGNNQYGQLGNNSIVNSAMPAQVLGVSQIASVAGGGFHSLALTSNGEIWAWGSNFYGALGNGSAASQSLIPVQVTDTNLGTATAVAGGYYHSLAVADDGLAWAWGHNSFGELGNNTTVNANAPVGVDYPIPTVVPNPTSQSLCNGSTTVIQLSTNTPGAAISWTVTANNVSGASNGTGNFIAQALTLINPNLSGSVTYTASAQADGCTGNPVSITVTVNPIPVATAVPSSQTISSNQTTRIDLSSSASGTTFCWTVTSSNVTGATAGCGAQIRQKLKLAPGKSSGSVTYLVTPSAGGCNGAPITVTVTVVK